MSFCLDESKQVTEDERFFALPKAGGSHFTPLEKTMPVGTVESWNDLRGFGFIQPDGDGPDVFVHAKFLDGCSELVPSQRVEYETEFNLSRGKWHAVDCRVI